jgi:hypothetical protein
MAVVKGSEYCFNHDPKKSRQRAQARKAGGQARHTPHFADLSRLPADVKTIDDANQILAYTLSEVAGMENSIARARVLLALHESFLRAIEIGQHEERIAALEARLKNEP